MPRTEIEIKQDDLHMEDYSFYFHENKNILILDYYRKMSRPSKRHGWKVDESYNRLDERGHSLKEAEVPLTDEIKIMALDKFVSTIRVVKQSER